MEQMPPQHRRLIPAEMVWLYPFGPLIAAPMLLPNALELSPTRLLLGFIGVCIPFVALSTAFHLLYTRVMPGLFSRIAGKPLRAAVHVLVVTSAASLIGLSIFPIAAPLCGHVTRGIFVVVCIAISGSIVFPALLFQRLRFQKEIVERQVMSYRQAALESQLSALQARTNPHFFFNSLNTIASLIADDPDLAERTLERMAMLFRYALDSSKQNTVPLEVEMQMVNDYLAIQSARYGRRLVTSVHVDDGLSQKSVPPLILQPLVENAVLHGMAERDSGEVRVNVFEQSGTVVFEVADDGPGPGHSAHEGSQTSVREITERLRLMYGEAAKFALESLPTGGCLARFSIPSTAQ
jgi:two-component system, LytTR family, sensor histidine kinase AlgZ